jgi:hypothetical protein
VEASRPLLGIGGAPDKAVVDDQAWREGTIVTHFPDAALSYKMPRVRIPIVPSSFLSSLASQSDHQSIQIV